MNSCLLDKTFHTLYNPVSTVIFKYFLKLVSNISEKRALKKQGFSEFNPPYCFLRGQNNDGTTMNKGSFVPMMQSNIYY